MSLSGVVLTGQDAEKRRAGVHWKLEILAFFQFLPTRISNGFVEGKNNRIKTLMRQAYGYRNFQNVRLRILAGNAL